ncbi:MAG: SDR family oxidoreductase [Sphingobacteriia bacterium]|nr:SDR family oxidoreductase [Sphingobacteriia bacterium]
MKKVALITGGAGMIGTAIVEAFALNGYDIVFTYNNNEEKARLLAKELEVSGSKVFPKKVDLKDNKAIKDLFSFIEKQFGKLDVIVNNAAYFTTERKAFLDISWEEIDEYLNTNVSAVIKICQLGTELLKKSGKGNIVNLSSEAGKFGGFKMSVYATTKGALNTLVISLARELADFNIRINNVSPAVIANDHNPPPSDVIKTIPLKRAGTPEEVAKLVYWLTTDDASYITGSTISITGGR